MMMMMMMIIIIIIIIIMSISINCNFIRQNCDQEKAGKILKYADLNNRNIGHVELKSDTSNKRGNWNHLKSFKMYLTNITSKHDVKELDKRATLVTAHVLQTVHNIYHGEQHCICHKW